MRWRSSVPLLLLLVTSSAHADVVEYYIGRDARQNIPSGTYGGLADPNANRLTLLYAHGNHYHAKGTYSYSGPASNPTVQPTNTGDFLPENGTSYELSPGSGVFSNKNAIGLQFRSTDTLAGYAPGSEEDVLHKSSGNRWSGSMTGSLLALELLSISDGLTIADANGVTKLAAAGDQWLLGDGSTLDFSAYFQVADALWGANYSATFRLLDFGSANAGAPWGESGQFTMNFQAVPEPSSVALLACGAVAGSAVLIRKRLRKSSRAVEQN